MPITSPDGAAPFPPRPLPETSTDPVELKLSPNDTRPHQYITLPNGLRAVVISDPETDKAAGCVRVSVGFMSDPDNLAGCAHFCEHMLAKSSTNYPEEESFRKYINEHGGAKNAHTYYVSTTYEFDVAGDGLKEAVDRVADLFINPVFPPSLSEREVNAVDNEFKMRYSEDGRRKFVLMRRLAQGRYSKFGTGNRTTLWDDPVAAGRDPRNEVEFWWKKHYCPRRTTLSFLGREDVDTLGDWVTNAFAHMPVITDGLPISGPDGVHGFYDSDPYLPEDEGRAVFMKPIKDTREIELRFVVPDVDHLHGVKPFRVLAYLLGDSGKGTLEAYMKRQGWAHKVAAVEDTSVPGFNVVHVLVYDVTPEGIEAWREVISAVFSYLDMLRQRVSGIETTFNEMRALGDIHFRFKERTAPRRYVQQVASALIRPVPPSFILSSPTLFGEYDEAQVRAALDHLDPTRVQVCVLSEKLPSNVEGTFDQVEPIYSTEYNLLKLDKRFLAGPREPIPQLDLPEPNPYIPTNFDVPAFTPQDVPALIYRDELSTLWHKRDERFLLPKSHITIKLKTPLANNSLRNTVLGETLLRLLRFEVQDDIRRAGDAGMRVSLSTSSHAVILSMSGYTDKLPLLPEMLLSTLVSYRVTSESVFKEIMEQQRQAWQNILRDKPYVQGGYFDLYVNEEDNWLPTDILAELANVTPADIDAFRPLLLAHLHIETYAHGSITREAALALNQTIKRVLGPKPLSAADKAALPRYFSIPQGSELIWQVGLGDEGKHNLVKYIVCLGELPTVRERALARLLVQVAKVPIFASLRTEQQLAYLCRTEMIMDGPLLKLEIMLESEYDPVYVENRIEEVLDVKLLDVIQALSDDDLARNITSVRSKLLETPKTMNEEALKNRSRIIRNMYDFKRFELDAECLLSVTKDELIAFYNTKVRTSSEERRKLSLHLRRQHKPRDDSVVRERTKYVEDIEVWKAGLEKITVARVDLDALKAEAKL